MPRNPIIAKAFRFLRFSENIGSGFHKMIQGWDKKYKLKPIIEGDFDYYKITFPLTKSSTSTKTNTKTNTKTSTKTNKHISKGEDKERKILELIENNPYLSAKELAAEVDLSTQGVRYHLTNLKKKRRIERKGHGKGGSWQIIK